MVRRRGLGWGLAVALGLALTLAACGAENSHRPVFHKDDKDLPEFSAARLGDAFEDDSVADFLTPEEREAVRRTQLPVRADEPTSEADEPGSKAEPAPESGDAPPESAWDRAGKASLAALGVGLSLAAAAAPYLLF